LVVAASALVLVACGDAKGGAPDLRSLLGGKEKHESNGDVVIHGNAAAYKVTPVATPGSVSGSVTIADVIAEGKPVSTGSASNVCGASIDDETFKVAGRALGGAVVWLDGLRAGKAFPDDRRIELESIGCKLQPRVQAALTGSAVNIIGHDQFRQHLRFAAGGETAPRAAVLVGGGEQVIPTELPLKAPGLVSVKDPDHAWTQAYLAVFDHPYFAVTAPNGTFAIDNVPPGRYTLHVWHESTKDKEQPVEVSANGALKVGVELRAK
jgi:hypothetical protein